MEAAQEEKVGEVPSEAHATNGVHSNSNVATNGDAVDRGVQDIARKAHQNNKGEKIINELVQVFDGLESPEKKMEALARKYLQLAADQKSKEHKLGDYENKHTKARKEKDHMQNEFNKLMISKEKMESVCRELQKHNKQIKEETTRYSEEEDRKRKELSQKFQSTIGDITAQMGENHKQNLSLKQDNSDLAAKMKGLIEQYEVREQHIEKVLKAKELELQLCEAKVQQQGLIVQEEMEAHLREKKDCLEEQLLFKKKFETMQHTETELRSQLALYTKKFEEFQNTLSKSNEVFAMFKKDMDTMSKTIQKLEKESQMWRNKWENTNHELLQMVEVRSQNQETIQSTSKKIEKLEKLCRAMQTETQTLRKQLKVDQDQTAAASSKPVAGSETVTQDESELPEADKEMSHSLQ